MKEAIFFLGGVVLALLGTMFVAWDPNLLEFWGSLEWQERGFILWVYAVSGILAGAVSQWF